MRFGLMIRGQYPQGDDMVARFDELLEQARLANTLGFDCITKGSHYAGAPLQDVQQLPFLARIAAEAPNCRLNAGLVLLPLHKPLDIAEQIATLDIISGGKVIFGCGLGYRDVEFNGFGTERKHRAPRFEENLEAIKRLWTEDNVSMVGSHFELKDATLSAKPVQKPYPPIWLGANAEPGIRRAARVADCWYIPPHNRVDTILTQLDTYKRALDETKRPWPEELPMRREVFVARTREEAIRLCRPSLEQKYKAYHQWGQDKEMPTGDDDLGQAFDELIKGRFFIGSPDEVADDILAMCRPTGVNHLVMSIHWPGMENQVALDAMQLFAEEVMPRVREAL
ncbi:MAG: LLM class flavin-dependent oxidoreductase [Gammaproteobacteria bacterium]|nr:LLM class flavin-dependent oxidoreductase [Gammaproteobacteria bacterium]